MIQSPIKSCCPPAPTPALSGESVFPQYLQLFMVFLIAAFQEELWGISFLGNTNFHRDATVARAKGGTQEETARREKNFSRN